MTYNILTETFCLYCQQDEGTPEALQHHVAYEHKDTYAFYAIRDALARQKKREA